MNHIYYFGASHCIQCRTAKPQFEAEITALNAKDITTIVDVDESEEMALKFNVRGIPHIVITDEDGGVIVRGHAFDMIPKMKDYV